jgi:hypothetical protein
MNERFAVIGACGERLYVCECRRDRDTGELRITRQTLADFRRRFMHIRIDVGDYTATGRSRQKSLGEWWTKHLHHRHFLTMEDFQKAVEGTQP